MQVRLVLVCAHDLRPVECGPDGKGYPVKIEKDWVKKLVSKLGPVLKVGLFAARAAVLALGIHAHGLGLPFLPRSEQGLDALTTDSDLRTIR